MNDDEMSFFFPELDPDSEGLVPVQPSEMRFLELRPEQVIDDGPKRFRVYVETTPFTQRPYIELALIDESGTEVTSANIIEPIMKKNVLTMHMRGEQKSGRFRLFARMFYPDLCESDRVEVDFEME